MNPENKKALILFSRFQQRIYGLNNKKIKKTFLTVRKKKGNSSQSYAADAYLTAQPPLKISYFDKLVSLYQDEKERYNMAVQIERLKIREQRKSSELHQLAKEAHIKTPIS